jgi:hypothetical protein
VIWEAGWSQQTTINSFLNPFKFLEGVVNRAKFRGVVLLERASWLFRPIGAVERGCDFGGSLEHEGWDLKNVGETPWTSNVEPFYRDRVLLWVQGDLPTEAVC